MKLVRVYAHDDVLGAMLSNATTISLRASNLDFGNVLPQYKWMCKTSGGEFNPSGYCLVGGKPPSMTASGPVGGTNYHANVSVFGPFHCYRFAALVPLRHVRHAYIQGKGDGPLHASQLNPVKRVTHTLV